MMKKFFFFAALAAVGLASCTNEKVVDQPLKGKAPINFNNYLGKATKATPTYEGTYYVWGGYDETSSDFFDAVTVTNNSYDDTRYWVPKKDYYFAALNVNSAKYDFDSNTLTLTEYKVPGNIDLIGYATDKIEAKESENEAVPLTLAHALSNVKLTFINSISDAYTLEITDVTLNGVIGTNTLTVSNSGLTWENNPTTVNEDGYTYNIANLTGENYLLPQTLGEVKLSFKVTVTNGVDILKERTFTNIALPKETVSSWTQSYVYNYNIKLTPDNVFEEDDNIEPIIFAGVVEEWTTTDDTDITIGE